MAEAANIGANFSSYQGNAALGGAKARVITLDTRPLQMFAAYKNLENKQYWATQQQNAKEAATQLGAIADLQLEQLIPEDQEMMKGEVAEAQEEYNKVLREPVPGKDAKGYIEWKTKLNKISGKINDKYALAKQRSINRVADIKLIEEGYANDPERQAIAKKELEAKIKGTSGLWENTQIWQAATIPDMAPVTSTTDIYQVGRNNATESTVTFWNVAQADSESNAMAVLGENIKGQGMPQEQITVEGVAMENPAYTEWAKGKSDSEISKARMQSKSNTLSPLLNGVLGDFKGAVAEFYKPDGTFDEAGFKAKWPAGTPVGGVFKQIQDASEYAKTWKARLTTPGGTFISNGVDYNIPSTVDKSAFEGAIVDDYRNIGAKNLLMGQSYANFLKAGGDKIESKTTTHNRGHDFALEAQKFNQRKELARIQESYVRSRPGATETDAKMITAPALMFDDHLMRISKIFGKGGSGNAFVSKENVDLTTREALRWDSFSRKTGNFNADKTPQYQQPVAVQYMPDGSYKILGPRKENGAYPVWGKGTLQEVQQGYISAVQKDLSGNTGALPQGFQGEAEKASGALYKAAGAQGLQEYFDLVMDVNKQESQSYYDDRANVKSINKETGEVTYKNGKVKKLQTK